MSFVGASIEDAARFGGPAQESGFDPAHMNGEAVFELLHRLALEEEHGAS